MVWVVWLSSRRAGTADSIRKFSNRPITFESNRAADSNSNWISKLRRSLVTTQNTQVDRTLESATMQLLRLTTWFMDLITCWSKHDNSRPHTQWRHWHNCNYHPVRPRELGIKSHSHTLLIWDPFEYLQHTFRWQYDFLLLWIFIDMFPLSSQLQTCAPYFRLVSTTSSMTLKQT